mmetsp:Transcript_46437/g.88660  ORF Transcript_46437/g.88660 Transcript_46437/m.88660 type:complete len:260 (-) Transcript_46437:239-1018(-)
MYKVHHLAGAVELLGIELGAFPGAAACALRTFLYIRSSSMAASTKVGRFIGFTSKHLRASSLYSSIGGGVPVSSGSLENGTCSPSSTTRYTIERRFMPSQGICSVASSHRMTPKEYTSAVSVYVSPLSTSGAIHAGEWKPCSCVCRPMIFDMPKSHTFNEPARSMSRFADLRSLCITPRACRYTIPRAASSARCSLLPQSSAVPPLPVRAWWSTSDSALSHSSSSSAGRCDPPPPLVEVAPRKRTTFGWCSMRWKSTSW